MSSFWFEHLQTYAAVALLVGAFIIMVDFLAIKLGMPSKKVMPPYGLFMIMLAWPLATGIFIGALCYELNRRR